MSESPVSPGVLSVSKPSGPTSRQIVDWAVRALGTRRVGHAGTLDPMAEGVLLLVWGRSTGLVPYLQEYPKSYRARVRFGRETDTQDRMGKVVRDRDPSHLTADAVREALDEFRGVIRQVPPVFSALKQGGKRLYQSARSGETVAVEPREREVSRFDLVGWDSPEATFDVTCQSGTYVRTLAHDLGQALGPGACLVSLVRTEVGPYAIADSLPAERIRDSSRCDLEGLAVSAALALPDWPSLTIPEPQAQGVVHGSWRDEEGQTRPDVRYRLLDEEGALLALVEGGAPPRYLRVFAGAQR